MLHYDFVLSVSSLGSLNILIISALKTLCCAPSFFFQGALQLGVLIYRDILFSLFM